MQKLIVVTHPGHINDEIDTCKELFDSGLERLHVRKYKWSENEITNWLRHFSKDELARMTIHHQQGIFEKKHLGGLHLKYSNDFSYSKDSSQTFSCSVHTWNEAKIALDYCDYIFISPVFDSISKLAYKQNADLLRVPTDLTEKKIFALGGIDNGNIHKIYEMGYYGAVVLGYIWNNVDGAVENFNTLMKLGTRGK
ncbi:MAG TPA: thiamine phosphate synthase [Bacteroidia bacterium]|jgi:thiamine-phosphate pyrophosphorylase|nr:thiamine phosphate synthase [Bacteroidia bacterium]